MVLLASSVCSLVDEAKMLVYASDGGPEPHVRLLSLKIRQRDWEFPGNLTLKASGI